MFSCTFSHTPASSLLSIFPLPFLIHLSVLVCSGCRTFPSKTLTQNDAWYPY